MSVFTQYKGKSFPRLLCQRGNIHMCKKKCWESGSGYNGAKFTQKNRKQFINFIFWSSGCSLLRAEGQNNFQLYLFSSFRSSKAWIRIRAWFTWNVGSGSGFKEPGSTTLARRTFSFHRVKRKCVRLILRQQRGNDFSLFWVNADVISSCNESRLNWFSLR